MTEYTIKNRFGFNIGRLVPIGGGWFDFLGGGIIGTFVLLILLAPFSMGIAGYQAGRYGLAKGPEILGFMAIPVVFMLVMYLIAWGHTEDFWSLWALMGMTFGFFFVLGLLVRFLGSKTVAIAIVILLAFWIGLLVTGII